MHTERKSTRRLPVHSNKRRSENEENENKDMRENGKFLMREVMKGKN